MPTSPPLAASAFSISSDSPTPATARMPSWLATTGARLASISCFCTVSVPCVMSIRMPSRFISRTIAKPRSVMPLKCSGGWPPCVIASALSANAL